MKAEKKRPTILERTAWHEAGHAVAAWYLRIKFKYVSIVPGEDTLGRISGGDFSKCNSPTQYAVGMIHRWWLEREIQYLLAGEAAETLLVGRDNYNEVREDIKAAVNRVLEICSGDKATEVYFQWLWSGTRELLLIPCCAAALKPMVDALLKQKRIDYQEACKIVVDAIEHAMANPDEFRKTMRQLGRDWW